MEKLNQEERKILSLFESRMDEIRNWKTEQLKEEITLEVKRAGYYTEDWQVHYPAEAIFETLQARMRYGDLTKEQIEYILSWSWAAFFSVPIFTLGSKLYLWTLGFFLPFYNIFLIFYLGRNGKRLSYLKGWKSFDEFRERQELLEWLVMILLGIAIGSQVLVIVILLAK